MSTIGLAAVLLTLLPTGPATSEGAPPSARRAVPAIPLCQAIERVEIWAAEHGIDISSQFVREVRLVTEPAKAPDGPGWEVIYQWATPRLGGELTAFVRMDGTITVRPLGP